jgi:RNA polymerase sigma-70 factor (ECF subfamily)
LVIAAGRCEKIRGVSNVSCDTEEEEDKDMESREHLWAEAMRADRRGDGAAYECLLKEIADQLRRLIRYRIAQLGLSAHETEDLVQEVLIGLHTKRHTWDVDRPFCPGSCDRPLQDRGRHPAPPPGSPSSHRPDFDELAELVEAPAEDVDRSLLDIDRHLSDLPQGQQTVVRALAVEGASVRSTAEKLQTSEGAVRVTFHRALQRLMAKAEAARTKPAKGKF